MKYYIIKNRKMPWGDYGNILFSGFLNVMDDNYDELEVATIERVGPYVPDIYIANLSNLVITDKIKNIFKNSNITGIAEYGKTEIKKIVNIDWEKWDKNKDPEFFPESDEPEDYIFEGKHDKSLVKVIPNLSTLKVGVKENKIYQINPKPDYINYTDLEIRDKIDEDIFMMENMLFIIVSEKFKNVLESNNISDLRFIELKYNPESDK